MGLELPIGMHTEKVSNVRIVFVHVLLVFMDKAYLEQQNLANINLERLFYVVSITVPQRDL